MTSDMVENEVRMTQKIKKNIAFILVTLIWFVEYYINIWYVKTYFTTYGMNSDFAGDAVFAKHLADSGHYILSKDWFPTTELYVIHHQLIMVPLFKIFDDYFKVWVITSVIAFLLLSICIFYFVKCISNSNMKSIFAVVLYLNPITSFNLEYSVFFHGYLFYYLLAFMLLHVLFANYGKNTITDVNYILTILLSVLAGLCGLRMFMLVFVPIVLAYIVCNYYKNISDILDAFTQLLICSLVSGGIGFVIYNCFLAPRFGSGSVINEITFNSAEVVKDNIISLPEMLIKSFGLNFYNSDLNTHAKVVICSIVFWVWIISNIVIAFVKNKEDKRYRFSVIFLLFSMFISMAYMVLTLENRWFAETYRYFAISTFLLIPLSVIGMDKIEKIRVKDIVSAIVVMMSIAAMFMWKDLQVEKYGDYEAMSWRQPYIDFLVDNGYTFGIGDYWNASSTTFQSNGKILMASVANDENYTYKEWNMPKSYEKRAPQFILLGIEAFTERADKDRYKVLYQDPIMVVLEYPQEWASKFEIK